MVLGSPEGEPKVFARAFMPLRSPGHFNSAKLANRIAAARPNAIFARRLRAPSPAYNSICDTPAYQVAFTENCSWREVVLVKVIAPANGIGFPRESMMARLSLGDVKFAWLMMLKKSARNWVLNASEIRGMGMFLDNELSSPTNPGPVQHGRRLAAICEGA